MYVDSHSLGQLALASKRISDIGIGIDIIELSKVETRYIESLIPIPYGVTILRYRHIDTI